MTLRRHKFAVLALLAAASIAVVWLIVVNAGASPTPAAGTPAQPPAWLQSGALRGLRDVCAPSSGTSTLTSVVWVKTTWGRYEQAIGGSGDLTSSKVAYVVVARGNFSSTMFGGDTTGTVLVLAFDGASRALGTVDLLHSESGLDASVLGAMSPLTLPAN